MLRFTYLYVTPMGTRYGDILARTAEEADRKFWSRHSRDTCVVLMVSAADDQEGEERPEKCGNEGCGAPCEQLGDDVGPVSVPLARVMKSLGTGT